MLHLLFQDKSKFCYKSCKFLRHSKQTSLYYFIRYSRIFCSYIIQFFCCFVLNFITCFQEILRIISKFVYIFIWKWILSNLTRFLGINLKIYVNYIAQKRNNRINLNKKKSSLCDIFVEIFYILRNIYTSLNAICGNVISHRSRVRSSSAVRFQTYQLRHCF